jgi:hypothetical protein
MVATLWGAVQPPLSSRPCLHFCGNSLDLQDKPAPIERYSCFSSNCTHKYLCSPTHMAITYGTGCGEVTLLRLKYTHEITENTPQEHIDDNHCVRSSQNQRNTKTISAVITLGVLLTKYQTITCIMNGRSV